VGSRRWVCLEIDFRWGPASDRCRRWHKFDPNSHDYILANTVFQSHSARPVLDFLGVRLGALRAAAGLQVISFTATAKVLFTLAMTYMIVSGFLTYAEIGEVNGILPNDQRISYLWGYPGKMLKIKRLYKQLCPTGRIDRFRVVSEILGILLGATAFAMGFSR